MSVVMLLAGANAVNIQRDPLLTWAPTAKGSGHPTNYFVPHFGEDGDIKSTKKNVADSEARFGHVLDTSDPPGAPPRNYFVPHFGEDDDVKYTKVNIAKAEKDLGHEYDTSAAASPPPRDYFVPHFGEDTEIKASK